MTKLPMESPDEIYLGVAAKNSAETPYESLLKQAFGDLNLVDEIEIYGSESTLESVDELEELDDGVCRFVFGSGYTNAFSSRTIQSAAQIFSVRGLLSRNRLHGDRDPIAIGDLGLLAEGSVHVESQTRRPLLIVENAEDVTDLVIEELQFPEFDLVGLNDSLDTIIDEISCHRFVFSTSVLGLALADVCQVRNAWLNSEFLRGASKFEVMDYYSSVDRNLSKSVTTLPQSEKGCVMATSLASPSIVKIRKQQLADAADRLRNSVQSLSEASLAKNPSFEERFSQTLSAPARKFWLKIAMSYPAGSAEKDYLVSFKLGPQDRLKEGEKIDGLFRSVDPSIGYFNYLVTPEGESTQTLQVNLPAGIECTGFEVIKFGKSAAQLSISEITYRALPSV